MSGGRRWRGHLVRAFGLLVLCGLALQLVLAGRVLTMAAWNPSSTAFQRSEAWRLLRTEGDHPWRQRWVPYEDISVHLKRAVIASEDAGFVEHSGIEWDAIESAWERNRKAAERQPAGKVKLVGGSTITQQLAKNLLLSGERTVWRKAQEAVLAFWLEQLLDKRRILELYLNHVEWGEGVFGAEAAAQRYFAVDARRLGPEAAARLAVMLPAPKRFEKRPGSAYLRGRAATIMARMGDVVVP